MKLVTSVVATLVATVFVASLAAAQTDRKKPTVTSGTFGTKAAAPKAGSPTTTMPPRPAGPLKGGTAMPVQSGSKGQGTTAPRPTSAAPLTAGECKGLGGKVSQRWTCMAMGGQACTTVDSDGVVRTVCLSK